VKLREHSCLDIEPPGVHEPDDRSDGLGCEVIRQVDSAIDLKVVIKIFYFIMLIFRSYRLKSPMEVFPFCFREKPKYASKVKVKSSIKPWNAEPR